jgi:hypothetical protein
MKKLFLITVLLFVANSFSCQGVPGHQMPMGQPAPQNVILLNIQNNLQAIQQNLQNLPFRYPTTLKEKLIAAVSHHSLYSKVFKGVCVYNVVYSLIRRNHREALFGGLVGVGFCLISKKATDYMATAQPPIIIDDDLNSIFNNFSYLFTGGMICAELIHLLMHLKRN